MEEDYILIQTNKQLQATTFIAISSFSTIAVATLPLQSVLLGNGAYQHTEKKEWLSVGMKDRCDGVDGSDASNLCGMNETAQCNSVGHAVGSSKAQLNSTITVLCGRHVSEGTTISVGEKKISVLGRGKTVNVIRMSALYSITLFSVMMGQLE
ncbi:uncharacterized protein MONOS_15349 [Monocercomonoides exilis]|uniref:uncharacterized protein n=1 Tax=Monocercomonoides exilis TaxID=2049356 RepID=UPI00355A66D1|nr:hypothetical protein MONOS_15349 [Monocercomonoides exilis]|eukprot:MONOS_15349.1-p1 / transcript=MONOS_15349.1 / gene=MONOS_15349 / organism=Monocercomonoides_exilis_PA203 / gene_product=unspecified product / transcript_product=unspecified product / location=Mono_scaffold01205:8785-9337(+) / protein_length=153 / sequence_SO=supercontig / SO=protein_coding / is_pseudo=false